MALRDLVIYFLVFSSLPFCVYRAYIGILIWCVISYLSPHRMTYAASHYPVAQYVGLATLVGFLIGKNKKAIPIERETIIFLLLWILITISTIFSINPERSWFQWKQVSKIFLMSLITIPLFLEKRKLRYLLITIFGSIGFYGIKGGIFSIIHAGQWRIWGPQGTFIEDNNDLALALLMVVPIGFYLAKDEKSKILKFIFYGSALLCIVSVIFTYSRGGFLGLSALIFIYFMKKKNLKLVILIPIIGFIFFSYFAPQQWVERMDSIQDYEEDRSATGRINAWWFAYYLAMDRPLTGGGFNCFTSKNFDIYAPNKYDVHDAHSIYFEILGEQGFISLIMFLSLLFSSILSLRNIKKLYGEIKTMNWVNSYSDMLQFCFYAYMVSGAFLGRAYFDLLYHLVSIVIILKVLSKNEFDKIIEDSKGLKKAAVV